MYIYMYIPVSIRSYLYRVAGGSAYSAKLCLEHLEVLSPRASSVAVAAYYHSAVLELRNLVKGHAVASPGATFEEAVLFGMASLGKQGMACPICKSRTWCLTVYDNWTTPSSKLALSKKGSAVFRCAVFADEKGRARNTSEPETN